MKEGEIFSGKNMCGKFKRNEGGKRRRKAGNEKMSENRRRKKWNGKVYCDLEE